MTVTVYPLSLGERRFAVGDQLDTAFDDALTDNALTLEDGDVIAVASKLVSLAERRLTPLPDTLEVDHKNVEERRWSSGDQRQQARRRLAREVAVAVVADTPEVLVTRTDAGFVVANSGIDTSNVPDGYALLLPADADASARQFRDRLASRYGVTVAVVITDSFGRAWRIGQLDTAVGAAGLQLVRDERGGDDLHGHRLEVTVAAIGDAIAAASDLVRSKASATPFVVIRGLRASVGTSDDTVAGTLVRPVAHDLFAHGGPDAAIAAIQARRTVRAFGTARSVPRSALRRAIEAAATAPAPHHSRPWRFIELADGARSRLLDTMARRWRDDLAADGLDSEAIQRRLERSDGILRDAPVLLACFVDLGDAASYPDERRRRAERDLFILSAGAALANAQIALSAQGLGAAWLATTAFCSEDVVDALDLDERWQAVGMLAVGWPRNPPPTRTPPPVDDLWQSR